MKKATNLAAALVLLLVALTVGSGTPAASADVVCPPTRAYLYTNDTQNLATRLGLNKSACADYYISISPIVTPGPTFGEPRDGAALTAVHTQGFHALAELRPSQWEPYAAANGWYATGVKLHDDMIAVGYDPARDTWAVNEVGSPSTVAFATDVFNGGLHNGIDARQAFRDFVHGLYDGSSGPKMPGVVFAADAPQLAPDVTDYLHKLSAWYADAPFWQDMRSYVSVWAQETYADPRAWGDANVSLEDRARYLNDYFLHGLRGAEQGNDATAAARAFLDEAYVSLENEIYPSDGLHGTPPDPGLTGMLRFISAQTYAQRSSLGTRLGFAVVVTASNATIESRVAATIHDSQSSPIGACTATGESCDFGVPGAAVTDSWRPNTNEGEQVAVSLDGTVSLTFDSVSARGSTWFSSSPSDEAPTGWTPAGLTYDIATTAVTSPHVRVCLGGAGHVFHRTSDGWRDITTSPGCGVADELGEFALFVDVTPPDVTCAPAPSTWSAIDVSIPCTASDGASGLDDLAEPSFGLSTSVAPGTETANASTNARLVCDNAGNCTTVGPIDGILVDRKGPSLDCGSAPTFLLNEAGAIVTASALDAGSGVPSASTSAPADTSAPGSHSVDLMATDNVGNSTIASCPFSVGYALSGFGRPIANAPTVNTGKAGRTYPVKWQLRDANGSYVSTLNAAARVAVQPTPCGEFATDPDSALTVTATGATSLRYDSEANQYVYNWAAPSTAGCYTLFVQLDSGQALHAYFQLS